MSLSNEESSSNNNNKPSVIARAVNAAKRAKKTISNNSSGTPTITNPKGHKNDPFYIAKRGLFRKAEGVVKRF